MVTCKTHDSDKYMYLGDMKGKSNPNDELFWKPRIM